MKPILIVAALALSGLAGVAHAQPSNGDGPSIDVFYGDLNLQRPAGADVMLARIHAAASFVCGGKPDTREVTDMMRYRSCVSRAIGDAVAQVNQAALTQLYANSAGGRRAITVARR